MFDIFSAYATNPDLENEGTWHDIGEARFLVARAGNKNYARKLTKAVERNRRALDRKDDAADKLSEQIMIDVMAETILLGWENVAFQKEPMPYSVDNAKKLLAIKDFRNQIAALADDFEAYKVEQEKESGED